MDKYRLLLSALFVTLSWGCMRTFAQTTVDPNSTKTAITTTEITANVTAETIPSTTAKTTTNITAETTANITAKTTANITVETTTNITAETTANITAETTANITVETTTNITAETTANITAETTANITVKTTANITAETTANITAETTANITAETTANITAETTANITAETTANITAETTANITVETTTNITVETTPNITAKTTANITAETTANITAETTANITAETTTNITVETTAIITTVVVNTTVAPTVPPVPPNNTVLSLPETVNKTGCGTTQLCAAEPSGCDPSADASCFFLGAKLTDGNNFEFALSGQSNGYIAASVLSPLNGKIVTYVCANSNNQVKFFGAIYENGILNLTTLHVTSVKGKVTGATIQCTFLATVPDPLDLTIKIRARRATDVTVSLSTGSFDATSQSLETPSAVIRATVDLAQPNTTVVNTIPKEAPTVAVLQTPVSNTGCGSEKLCRADPSSCNPAAVGTCSFFSAKQNTGQIYFLEISGQSSGYIGSILSIDTTWGNNDLAYLCANNNGRVTFISALFDGTKLTVSQLNVTSGSEAGRVDGNTIQCSFEATLPDTNTRAADYAVAMINGTYNTGTGVLGNPFILFNTSILNLTDVANSSPGVVPHQQSLLHVLLFSATVLSLTILTGH